MRPRPPRADDPRPPGDRPSAEARPAAAAMLATPLPLLAVALLVVNDHWAKAAYPGWLTGKLSDVAGLAFFPLLLTALVEATLAPFGVRPPPRRLLAAACAATVLAFALVKTTEIGNATYRVGLGYAQWPVRALAATASGRPPPPPRAVVLLRDLGDLVALPFVGVAYALGTRRLRAARRLPRAPRPVGVSDGDASS